MSRFPRTNFHELNLDWIINEVKKLDKKVQQLIDSGGGGGAEPYDGIPANLGTAAPGISNKFARGDHVHQMPNIPAPINPYNNAPAALGTASPGVSNDFARGDHVHPKPSYTASDVGAVALPVNPSTGDFMMYDGNAWTAQSIQMWNGGDY